MSFEELAIEAEFYVFGDPNKTLYTKIAPKKRRLNITIANAIRVNPPENEKGQIIFRNKTVVVCLA